VFLMAEFAECTYRAYYKVFQPGSSRISSTVFLRWFALLIALCLVAMRNFSTAD
jgi:hypothetical protein